MTHLIHTNWHNFIKEHPAAVNPDPQMGLITHLLGYGILRISGPDAIKFLQGQLTCDVMQVTSTGTLAAHCNPQGRIISLFFLTKHTDQFFLLMPDSMLNICLSALKKYAVFYRVQLQDISDQYLVLGFTQTNHDILQQIPHAIVPEHRAIGILSLETAQDFWLRYGDQVSEMPSTSWEIINLQMLLPTIYPSTTEKFLPHELDLHRMNAISFEKGCYTGQEIIARMHYRGKLKQKICHFMVDTTTHLLPGDEIETQLNEKKLILSLVDYQPLNSEKAHALLIAPLEFQTIPAKAPVLFHTIKDQQPIHLFANENLT